MKKIFIAAIILATFGCNSNEKETTEDAKGKNVVGVPNTDGTIPDTTNAINLSTQKKDTIQKDSL